MRLSRQFQACLIFFTKIFRAQQKHSQADINQQNKIKQTLNNKANIFLCAETSKSVKVAFFCILVLFVRAKSSRKKNKQT